MSKFGAVLVSLATLAPIAGAQCSDWTAGFGSRGADRSVDSFAMHDDGSGPALYVGGRFTNIGDAGAARVAKWNGNAFEPLGAGVGSFHDHTVAAMASYDAGSGPELVVAGSFTTAGGNSASNIASWDGSAWTPLGAGLDGDVRALAVYDAGSGPELYAGGLFLNSGGVPLAHVARWNGSAWLPVGGGVDSPQFFEEDVRALAVFQSKLYVGGSFQTAGSTATRHLAAWDGSNWSSPAGAAGVAGPFSGTGVYSLATFDDGNGIQLYVGGNFSSVDGAAIPRLARYDGSTWSSAGLAPPLTTTVAVLRAFDGASGVGPSLWAAGPGDVIPGVDSDIARFDGTTWTTPGSGTTTSEPQFNLPSLPRVNAIASWSRNGTTQVLVGGSFQYFSAVESWNISTYDSPSWSAVHEGVGTDGELFALGRADVGGADALYAGGRFHRVGGERVNSIARWDGSAWLPLGSGETNGVYNNDGGWTPGVVSALCSYDSGSGTELWVGGQFVRAGGAVVSNLARWNGTSWTAANLGYTAIYAMLVHDDGSGAALWIVGRTASGPACTLKRWNGTSATTIGVFGSAATCLAEFQGDLYVAGDFWEVGTLNTKCFARWDGTSWHAVGDPAGAPLYVSCMAVHDDGTGPALYAGGHFSEVSFVPAQNVVRWDGTAFTSLGSGISGAGYVNVASLRSFDGRLIAAGNFAVAGGNPANNIAAWDGSAWSALGAGLGGIVAIPSPFAMAEYDEGTGLGASLFVGGEFGTAGPHAATNLARLARCGTAASTFCHGDGSAAACPCANASAVGADAGCLNSFGLGATLRVHGRASLAHDSLELCGARMTNSSALYLQAGNVVNGGLGFAFGDGVKCTSGPFVRLGTKLNAGGASSYPQVGNLPVSMRGFVTAPGTRHYQVHYRNSAAFCAPETFNMTNAVTVLWEP